eukprot:gene31548-6734_t
MNALKGSKLAALPVSPRISDFSVRDFSTRFQSSSLASLHSPKQSVHRTSNGAWNHNSSSQDGASVDRRPLSLPSTSDIASEGSLTAYQMRSTRAKAESSRDLSFFKRLLTGEENQNGIKGEGSQASTSPLSGGNAFGMEPPRGAWTDGDDDVIGAAAIKPEKLQGLGRPAPLPKDPKKTILQTSLKEKLPIISLSLPMIGATAIKPERSQMSEHSAPLPKDPKKPNSAQSYLGPGRTSSALAPSRKDHGRSKSVTGSISRADRLDDDTYLRRQHSRAVLEGRGLGQGDRVDEEELARLKEERARKKLVSAEAAKKMESAYGGTPPAKKSRSMSKNKNKSRKEK